SSGTGGRPSGSAFAGRAGPRRSGPLGPPPTLEAVSALARRERVPLRIAKGELQGKMKCRIWRKLHGEEAKRFDQAYALVAANPQLALADAFGIIQSGLSVEEFRGRRDRSQRRSQVKVARQGVNGEAIQRLFQRWREENQELSVLLGERTLVDLLEAEQAVSL